MWLASVVSLVIVCLLCPIGIFSRTFEDNLLQRIGMVVLCIACCGRVEWIWLHEFVDASWMCVHVGMCLYALGAAQKVTLRFGRDRGWRWLERTDRWIDSRKGEL